MIMIFRTIIIFQKSRRYFDFIDTLFFFFHRDSTFIIRNFSSEFIWQNRLMKSLLFWVLKWISYHLWKK